MVRVELQGYNQALGRYYGKPVNKATQIALGKVAKSAVSTASSEIRTVYNVKKSDLDPRLTLRLPRPGQLLAEITISGKGMSLSYFGARQTSGNRVITRSKGALKTKTMKRSAKVEGVQVEVLKGRKTILKSAFLARMRSGHIGVMRRVNGQVMKGRERYGHTKHGQAITEKGVISIAYMVRNAKVEPVVIEKVKDSWDKIFPHELEFQLSKGQRS